MGAGDAAFKLTTGFLGLATVLTGVYLTASMAGAYTNSSLPQKKDAVQGDNVVQQIKDRSPS